MYCRFGGLRRCSRRRYTRFCVPAAKTTYLDLDSQPREPRRQDGGKVVGPELFITAAARFTGGLASRRIRDWRVRRKLNTAYPEAALRVINHYGRRAGTSEGSNEWNGIVNLLRDPVFGDYLNGVGTLSDLKAIYSESIPPLLDIIIRMSRLIAPVCRSILPAHSEGLVRYLNARDAARLAQADEAAVATNSLVAEQGETLRRIESLSRQTLKGLYTATTSAGHAGPASSPALSLPSDEHYRVERPQLAELGQRLSSEGLVGIGGGGGVGKSLLAVRYARQTHLEKTL